MASRYWLHRGLVVGSSLVAGVGTATAHGGGPAAIPWFLITGVVMVVALGSFSLVGGVTRYTVSARRPLTGLQSVGLVAAAFSAGIHTYTFLRHDSIAMLLAAVGFIGGGLLVAADWRRDDIILGAIPFTLLQVGLWALLGMRHLTTFGGLDKLVQLLLVAICAHLIWGTDTVSPDFL